MVFGLKQQQHNNLIILRGLSPRFGNNFKTMKNNLETIKLTVDKIKDMPSNAFIEYNFEKLPEHEEVKEDNFFGFPAKFNPERTLNTVNIIYKLA